jgi:hypothetical protein
MCLLMYTNEGRQSNAERSRSTIQVEKRVDSRWIARRKLEGADTDPMRKDRLKMASSRRIEAICGVAAGALGLVALGAALFAPLVAQSGCTTTLTSDGVTQTDCSTATPISIAQAQGLASLIPVITAFSVILISIAVFALLHSAGRWIGSLILLWISVALLWLAMTVALLSIGIFFAPSALLALVAAIFGSLPVTRGALSPTVAR